MYLVGLAPIKPPPLQTVPDTGERRRELEILGDALWRALDLLSERPRLPDLSRHDTSLPA